MSKNRQWPPIKQQIYLSSSMKDITSAISADKFFNRSVSLLGTVSVCIFSWSESSSVSCSASFNSSLSNITRKLGNVIWGKVSVRRQICRKCSEISSLFSLHFQVTRLLGSQGYQATHLLIRASSRATWTSLFTSLSVIRYVYFVRRSHHSVLYSVGSELPEHLNSPWVHNV